MKKTKKMKKWISFALIFCMLAAFMPAYAEEAEGFSPEEWKLLGTEFYEWIGTEYKLLKFKPVD